MAETISISRSAYSLVKEFNKKDPVQYFDYDLARPGVYMLFSEDNKNISKTSANL